VVQNEGEKIAELRLDVKNNLQKNLWGAEWGLGTKDYGVCYEELRVAGSGLRVKKSDAAASYIAGCPEGT
jgi:hypothetical protein